MPRVVLDLRKWDDYGIGTYCKALTEGLRQLADPDLQVHALHPGPVPVVPFPTRPFGAGDYTLRAFLGLGRAARRSGADLLHVPHFTLPLNAPPAVLTVHDLTHLRFPEAFGPFRAFLLRRYLRWALPRARRLIAVSGATRDELEAFLPALMPRIRVIPNAALPEFYDAPPGLGGGHYLFVGNDKPHKDLPVLLEAWSRFHRAHPDERLVMVSPVVAAAPGVEVRSRVSRDDLVDLYDASRALLAPSRWEGFDLPVLEALLRRVPAVASDIPAHRELLGADHPFLFPAGDPKALFIRLEEVHRRGLSEERLDALRERHRPHSPRAMAEATAAVYREALGQIT